MSVPEVGAVVVGAGVAGLAAALELQRSVGEVLVIDASDRPGGMLRTDHVSGYVVERGPNTIQIKAPAREFFEGLGLEVGLHRARPASRNRYVLRDGRLEAVPLSPLGLVRTPLLSARGKLRLLAEPLVRRGDADAESVAEFARRRMGGEVVSGLIGPFLTGIYAGDEDRLGASAVFPGLADAERRYGSIAIGLAAQGLRRKPRGLPGTYSAAEGLGPFARRLAERLTEPPALDTRVTAIDRDGAGCRLSLSGPGGERTLRSGRVVVAAPAHEAAGMLRGLDAELADGLASIRYAPIAGIPLGVDPGEVDATIEGFGFLVPREEGMRLLGCLFMSRLFEARAPAGRELLQCLVGGARWPEVLEESDEALIDAVRRDLERALGVRGELQPLGVARWPRAIPQPEPGHVRLVAELRRRAEALGLRLAGSYLDGVSVADALASGLRAARSAV